MRLVGAVGFRVGESEGHDCALVQFALDPDVAVMDLHDGFYDRQSKPGAVRGTRCSAPKEAIENMWNLL